MPWNHAGVSLISLGLLCPASFCQLVTALAAHIFISAFFSHLQPERSLQDTNYIIILLYKSVIPWLATVLM